MEDLQKFFRALDLKDDFSLGLMDRRHILIRLSNEADFYRIWSRNIWYVQDVSMRIFKWSTDFHVDRESSVVPVWFSLPKLPIHLFHKECLFSIVACLGWPLCVDTATAMGSRPSVARVCVEVDLQRELPERVWISVGDRMGFWQVLMAENLPKYCGLCLHQGHNEDDCRLKHPGPRLEQMGRLQVERTMQRYQQKKDPMAGHGTCTALGKAGKCDGGARVALEGLGREAAKKLVGQSQVLKSEGTETCGHRPGNGHGGIRSAVGGAPEGVAGTVVGVGQHQATLEAEVEATVAEPARGMVGVLSNGERGHAGPRELTDVNLSVMEMLVEEAIERAADSVMQAVAERVVVEETATVERNGQQRELQLGHCEAEPLQQPLMVSTGRSGEQRDVEAVEGRTIEISQVAGDLSPRMVVVPEPSSASLFVELNIEHPGDAGKGLRTSKGRGARVRIPSDRQLRGVSRSPNLRRLLRLVRTHGISVVAISEPKMNVSRIEGIRLRLAFDFTVVNQSGDLWIFFNAPCGMSIVRDSNQHISLSVHHPWLLGPLIFSFVHARCSMEERRELWASLLRDKPRASPWRIGGDFNVITAPHEKHGGRPFAMTEGVEFLSFMEEAGVFDAGFSSPSFTWCNNRRGRSRIWKRLDRLVMNEECLGVASAVSVVHLARHPSDHSPLKISFRSRLDNKPRPFRFLNMWTARPDLMEVIREAWNRDVQGSPLRIFCAKLMAVRRNIQRWNRQVFGNIFDAVKRAEAGLQRAEKVVETDASEEAQMELQGAQAELRRVLAVEEQF
ncbi:uncharacterized protein [Coffea arabica]|uniref:DUF4283 domain-containing protein n=1 Tax=Coffea arabica TaxID=13443 RepID=A0ABM4VSS3_COFAR